MAILSAQTIRASGIVTPCSEASKDERNCSRGLSACGYDISLAADVMIYSLPSSIVALFAATLLPWPLAVPLAMYGVWAVTNSFVLAGAAELFNLPDDVMARVCDKSSLARMGVNVQNTILEPGWRGYVTLEIANFGLHNVRFKQGCAVAQVVFERLDEPTDLPYSGKYQDQAIGPVRAR